MGRAKINRLLVVRRLRRQGCATSCSDEEIDRRKTKALVTKVNLRLGDTPSPIVEEPGVTHAYSPLPPHAILAFARLVSRVEYQGGNREMEEEPEQALESDGWPVWSLAPSLTSRASWSGI